MSGRRKPGQKWPSDVVRKPRPSDLLPRKDRPSDLVRRAAVAASRDARFCPRCGGYSRAPGGHLTERQCSNYLIFDAYRERRAVEGARVAAILCHRLSPP